MIDTILNYALVNVLAIVSGVAIIAANLYHLKDGKGKFYPLRMTCIAVGLWLAWSNFAFLAWHEHWGMWFSYVALCVLVLGVSVLKLEG